MIVTVTMKTVDWDINLSPHERDMIEPLTERYCKWGEYFTLEFDTEEMEVRVVEQS